MKKVIVLMVSGAATPVAAHQEVVMAASFLPLAVGMVTITLAGLTAWRGRLKTDKTQSSELIGCSNAK